VTTTAAAAAAAAAATTTTTTTTSIHLLSGGVELVNCCLCVGKLSLY